MDPASVVDPIPGAPRGVDLSITVHQRRALRKLRERVVTLSCSSEARMFCRGMELLASNATDITQPMTVFRVDYRRGLLHVTVPMRGEAT